MLKNASDKNSENPRSAGFNGENVAPSAENAVPKATAETPRFVAPTHGGVDILKLLTELEDLVENTPKRLGVMFRFDEDRFHMMIMKIRANLPEEMKRASKLARDSERIVEEAQRNAERIVEDARQGALVEFERGKAEAQQLQNQAQAETRYLREEAQRETRQLREQTQREMQQLRDDAQRETQQLRETAQSDVARLREDGEHEASLLQNEAKKASEEILADARAQAARLVADSEIVQQAQTMANDLQARVYAETAAVRQGADDYARDLLTHMEGVLGKAVAQVQRGREMLERGR